MNLVQALRARGKDEGGRSGLSLGDLAALFGGHQYPVGLNTTWGTSNEEAAPVSFDQYAMQLFADNPVVFAAVTTRLAVFSQGRLQWRRFRTGRPADLFGDPRLRLFERPWPGGTTSDLLGRMLLHNDLAGNAFVWNSGRRLHVWRPDWVTIVLGSKIDADHPADAEDVEVAAYLYHPGGAKGSSKARMYLPDEVAHFAPQADPLSHYRGMSWLTPVIREIQGDKAATEHKAKFFSNAATPNLMVRFDKELEQAKVRAFKELMEEDHRGTFNAYKTLYLGGGADATVIGANMQQLDFSATQGKGETRIAMAAGVHPVILGASEGLQGSSLNAGNYGQAKRLFSDVRLQHLWNNAAASLSVLAPRSDGAQLAFDTSQIPFLQDDLKDTAEIQQKRAQAIRSLTEAGYEPSSVVDAVNNDDFTLLRHTGVFSVQLQPPGAGQENPDD